MVDPLYLRARGAAPCNLFLLTLFLSFTHTGARLSPLRLATKRPTFPIHCRCCTPCTARSGNLTSYWFQLCWLLPILLLSKWHNIRAFWSKFRELQLPYFSPFTGDAILPCIPPPSCVEESHSSVPIYLATDIPPTVPLLGQCPSRRIAAVILSRERYNIVSPFFSVAYRGNSFISYSVPMSLATAAPPTVLLALQCLLESIQPSTTAVFLLTGDTCLSLFFPHLCSVEEEHALPSSSVSIFLAPINTTSIALVLQCLAKRIASVIPNQEARCHIAPSFFSGNTCFMWLNLCWLLPLLLLSYWYLNTFSDITFFKAQQLQFFSYSVDMLCCLFFFSFSVMCCGGT